MSTSPPPPNILSFSKSPLNTTSNSIASRYSFEDSNIRYVDLSRVEAESVRKDIGSILERVPFIVLAEDDDLVRKSIIRTLSSFKGRGLSKLLKLDSSVQESFEKLNKIPTDQLPIIICRTPQDAEEAAKIISEVKGFYDGLMIYDHCLGAGPTGMDIFKRYHEGLPPSIHRILQTSHCELTLQDALSEEIIHAKTDKVGPDSLIDIAKIIAPRIRYRQHEAQNCFTKNDILA